ncbi:MAG: hypothetical protein JWR36_1341 [Glaciihabitans sp.]|nr:hypothetical protein [Glaciihabitans sp.]MDQ1569486.1 hypothetical protein [Actinomycetota bacterium]
MGHKRFTTPRRASPTGRKLCRMPGKSTPEPVALASVARVLNEGRTTVVFHRTFASSRDHVWELITDPDLLRLWAPHTADRDLGSVGKVTFTMLGDVVDSPTAVPDIEVPGAVLIAIPYEQLEHSWAGDVLAWQLDDEEDGTGLTLRHTLSDAAMTSAVAAGWHLCLDVAGSALAGHPTAPVRGMEAMNHGWTDLNERYAIELGVEPTRLDLA